MSEEENFGKAPAKSVRELLDSLKPIKTSPDGVPLEAIPDGAEVATFGLQVEDFMKTMRLGIRTTGLLPKHPEIESVIGMRSHIQLYIKVMSNVAIRVMEGDLTLSDGLILKGMMPNEEATLKAVKMGENFRLIYSEPGGAIDQDKMKTLAWQYDPSEPKEDEGTPAHPKFNRQSLIDPESGQTVELGINDITNDERHFSGKQHTAKPPKSNVPGSKEAWEKDTAGRTFPNSEEEELAAYQEYFEALAPRIQRVLRNEKNQHEINRMLCYLLASQMIQHKKLLRWVGDNLVDEDQIDEFAAMTGSKGDDELTPLIEEAMLEVFHNTRLYDKRQRKAKK